MLPNQNAPNEASKNHLALRTGTAGSADIFDSATALMTRKMKSVEVSAKLSRLTSDLYNLPALSLAEPQQSLTGQSKPPQTLMHTNVDNTEEHPITHLQRQTSVTSRGSREAMVLLYLI